MGGGYRMAHGCCRQLLGSTKLEWLVQQRVVCTWREHCWVVVIRADRICLIHLTGQGSGIVYNLVWEPVVIGQTLHQRCIGHRDLPLYSWQLSHLKLFKCHKLCLKFSHFKIILEILSDRVKNQNQRYWSWEDIKLYSLELYYLK